MWLWPHEMSLLSSRGYEQIVCAVLLLATGNALEKFDVLKEFDMSRRNHSSQPAKVVKVYKTPEPTKPQPSSIPPVDALGKDEVLTDEELAVGILSHNWNAENTDNDVQYDSVNAGYDGDEEAGKCEEERSILERPTLDGRSTEAEASDDEILADFVPKIRQYLHGGDRELARVGAELCFAKEALARKKELSNEREGTFTGWYQKEFNLSPGRARRLMRWVRPVLDKVQWDDDEDKILNELVVVGPCRFDEVQKLPEDAWRYDETGRLLLSCVVTGGSEVAVKDLSFREVKELREKVTDPDKGHGLLGQAQDVDEREGEDDSPVDNPEGANDDATKGADGLDDDTDADDAEAGETDNGSAGTAINTKLANNGIENLAETDPDLWEFGESEVKKLSVIVGRIRTKGNPGHRVSGVNVKLSMQDEQLHPEIVDKKDDAFYVLKEEKKKKATIHWYDHERDCW